MEGIILAQGNALVGEKVNTSDDLQTKINSHRKTLQIIKITSSFGLFDNYGECAEMSYLKKA